MYRVFFICFSFVTFCLWFYLSSFSVKSRIRLELKIGLVRKNWDSLPVIATIRFYSQNPFLRYFCFLNFLSNFYDVFSYQNLLYFAQKLLQKLCCFGERQPPSCSPRMTWETTPFSLHFSKVIPLLWAHNWQILNRWVEFLFQFCSWIILFYLY